MKLTYHCTCGKTHTITTVVHHYDRVTLCCGSIVWAIQPKRDGPLVISPWPGRNLTREEMGGRPSAETIVRRMSQSAIPPC